MSNSTRHLVSTVDDIEDGERFITEIEGREICVINADGEYYAVANYCIHQGGPVCEGSMGGYLTVDERKELVYKDEENILCCPWHAWEFDVKTGKHVTNDNYQIPTYDIQIEDDNIYVTV
ncbi:Rieske (2Fe-2S) protein [Natronobiforma cellulositropha]|uniref:Rieske (2Fe-2S) protein n=1 Tax=Natronobiforma cellulositropha TaxID=1679076 RepID=UPI0021D5754C|nr:Rieske (2Fe-2S) protein [Natronobiforma cellulositropha]